MSPSPCKSCGALVRWAMTEEGKPMPVDATPTEDGNLSLWSRATGDGVQLVVKPYDGTAALKGARRYTSHFATCPQADRWRKRRLPRDEDDAKYDFNKENPKHQDD